MSNLSNREDLQERVELRNPESLYSIEDMGGNQLDFERANGQQLLEHYRHNMTNHDEILDEIQSKQGYVTEEQKRKIALAAAEEAVETLRDEHIRVLQESQKKGFLLKDLLTKAGVGTAVALSNLLDSWSEEIKTLAGLKNSQRTLQMWNDTYRVQKKLVEELLKKEGVSPDIREKVNRIHRTHFIEKVSELGSQLLDLEKSEILKLAKPVVNYEELHKVFKRVLGS